MRVGVGHAVGGPITSDESSFLAAALACAAALGSSFIRVRVWYCQLRAYCAPRIGVSECTKMRVVYEAGKILAGTGQVGERVVKCGVRGAAKDGVGGCPGMRA